MFKRLKQGGNETVSLGKITLYKRVVKKINQTDYRKKIYLFGLPFSVYSHSEIEGKNKWRFLGIQITKKKRTADAAPVAVAAVAADNGKTIIDAEVNCLNDSYMRLAGHDKEAVRTVYLAPDRYGVRQQNSKRVLFIGHEFTVTGAPASLLDIAKLLIAEGYLVDIAVKNTPKVSDLHMYDGIGADVFLLPTSTKCVENAESIVSGYDLVIVNTIIMGAYAELCRTLGIPHLWFIREDLPSIEHYFVIIPGCRERFLGDAENILCVSKYVADCVNEKYEIKCRYINNFINDCFSTEAGRQQKNAVSETGRVRTFAVVGSVHKRKSQESAAAAFMYLSATPGYKDRWKLLFIGKYGRECPNPDLGEKLESVTRNIPNIVWCGQVTENKFDLFRTADFFIIPSLEEASSRVAIEAAMLGKPVIVTSHVGAKYLADSNAGFVYEPGNTAELRDIIIRCLDMTDDEYLKMSRQVRLNYEKTSSPSVYYKALSAIILDADERCGALSGKAETAGGMRSVLRSLGSGKNVITAEHFEYIKFADLADYGKHAEWVPSGKPAKKGRYAAVGVVIPVYNGIEHLKVLLPSLFKNTDLPHLFVFVDDCSGAETAEFLSDAIKDRDDCVLVKNETNLGFVKSINRGAAKALESCGNFVMLNSDTEVPSGWLGRIMKPFLEDEKISSVTPLSNRCNIFSFPFFDRRERNDVFLKEFGLEGINEAIRSSGAGRYINLPTGHGFCMAVSGKVWEKIGGLNEALFGRGYGEENEWCQRAELDGFRNILFPGLYVAHHEKGSFTTEEKKANCAASQQVISVMFPSYMRRVRDFTREYPSSDSIVSIYLSLARQKGHQPEVFTDPDLFEKRMSEGDGIFAIRHDGTVKIAVKLLGEVIFVGNARNSEKAGIEV